MRVARRRVGGRRGRVALVLVGLGAVLGAARPAPQPAVTITVVLEGGEGAGGLWGVSLFTAPAGFPQEHEQAVHTRLQPRAGARDSAVFRDLPPGRYAIAAFHDANGNRTFDTNRLGMPREAWAVSNGVRPRLRAPRFEEAVLTITADTRVVLRVER